MKILRFCLIKDLQELEQESGDEQEREIGAREDEIRRLNESMKFFKLELINREQNYNKIFNANPHIGVLNPLENKVL